MAESCGRHEQPPDLTATARARRFGGALAAALAVLMLECGGGSDNRDSGLSSGGSSQSESTGGASGETGGAATGGSTSDPFAAAQKCTSGNDWSSGEGPTMRPGEACISCHSASGGPRLAVAGTVYPTAHEPDDCDGA